MFRRLHRLWIAFRTPSARWAAGTLFVAGGVAFLLSWSGFSSFMAYSNTLAFCTSCHEMKDYVGAEYEQSPHFRNRSGVRAVCSDCHVPHALGPKLMRKFQASYKELPAHFLGKIDTPEKFAAHRRELAENEWRVMKSHDSRECRNCHSPDAMDPAKQKPRAQAQHADMARTGETCIDCHKGIAHQRPDVPDTAKAKDDDFSL